MKERPVEKKYKMNLKYMPNKLLVLKVLAYLFLNAILPTHWLSMPFFKNEKPKYKFVF